MNFSTNAYIRCNCVCTCSVSSGNWVCPAGKRNAQCIAARCSVQFTFLVKINVQSTVLIVWHLPKSPTDLKQIDLHGAYYNQKS